MRTDGGKSRGLGRFHAAAWMVALAVFIGAFVVVWSESSASSSPPRQDHAEFLAGKSSSGAAGLDPEPTGIRLTDDGSYDGGRLQRGKAVSKRVTAEELYSAYSQIRSEYDEKAFRVHDDDGSGDVNGTGSEGWKTVRETADGVEIHILSHPSDPSCPYVRMRAVMPGSVEEVWDFLRLDNWERTMPKMDPFYEGLSVLGRYVHRNVDMVLARKRTKRILTFGKRDFTFVSVSDVPLSDGVWVSGTVSVVTPRFPRQSGYTRAFQDSVAFYEPLPSDPESGEGRTRLTIVCRIDLNDSGEGGEGGAVPMWIYVRTIGVSGVASIQSMRKQLVLDREERRQSKKDEEKKVRQKRRMKDLRDTEEEPVPCPLFPWIGPKKRQTIS